ncbi:TonB-dependent receptor [Flammeovirga sp. SJP92]|uniref:TonB-dependent receptor n=1 Tax=Flammeovirga sp. SJP92 TaxID=1775430 RepID=UPI0007883E8C|nr:TonB-dependent receptor [Flammeovirga sp. SJP92]KXX69029.1 TonB-dependent receptor [Flammeovirga sp. SJP92]
MKKATLLLLSIIASLSLYAQEVTTVIKGTVIEQDVDQPVIGASIVIKGTTIGTTSDFDGNFSLKTSKTGDVTLIISFVGLQSVEQKVTLNGGEKDLGTQYMGSDAIGLAEVEVIASVAIDRKTPVAVSTVKSEAIEEKLGTKEFPEILKSTPGVYATKQGGGFGDSRINLRGFSDVNVAVLINGVPVNDMENGNVYWSNWAGLSDVTRSMQVQRGLGASKVAVPSIGGTINILTKTTDAEKGGNIYYGVGNNGREKIGLTLSTGKMNNGWAVTFSGSRTTGLGWVDATQFEGYSYFLNVSKEINSNHLLSFTAFGAPQSHGQRRTRKTIDFYDDYGIQANPDWGYLDGQTYNLNTNYYHKPQISLNHYWTINDHSNLSTSAYVSIGRGGGTGTLGAGKVFDDNYRRNDGLLDWERIRAENVAGDTLNGTGSETILRASVNNHNWYGILSVYDNQLSDRLTFLGGVDFRYYKGLHYQEVVDLLGGSFFASDNDINEPNKQAVEGQKVGYNNDGEVYWVGGFAQLEYSNDNLAAFVSAALSNTTYYRYDYFNYTPENQKSDSFNFLGYSIKGGLNYNIDEHNNVFLNTGYLSRAPFFRTVFPNFRNEGNKDAVNEKIYSVEVGYGYRHSKWALNGNFYYTKWMDRAFTRTIPADPDNGQQNDSFANLLGVNATHMGFEFDARFQPTQKLTITAMASIGDWTWDNDVEGVVIFDENQNPVDTVNVYIAGLKVGNAAQTTAAVGLSYEFLTGFKLGVDYNYFGNNYSDFDPTRRGNQDDKSDSWKIPDYNIVDLNLSYRFDIGNVNTLFTANVDNIFGEKYISDATDGFDHSMQTAEVYYGLGTTYSMGLKLSF